MPPRPLFAAQPSGGYSRASFLRVAYCCGGRFDGYNAVSGSRTSAVRRIHAWGVAARGGVELAVLICIYKKLLHTLRVLSQMEKLLPPFAVRCFLFPVTARERRRLSTSAVLCMKRELASFATVTQEATRSSSVSAERTRKCTQAAGSARVTQ